jgi:hypothetical protein
MLFSNEFHSFALFFAFVRIYSGKFSKFFLISASPPCFFHFLSLYQKPFFVLLFPGEEMWQVVWRQVQARRLRSAGKNFGGGGEACGRAAE